MLDDCIRSELVFDGFPPPGLGTSTAQEAKEYFLDMARHRIPFKYSGPADDEAITLVITAAFSFALLLVYNPASFLKLLFLTCVLPLGL